MAKLKYTFGTDTQLLGIRYESIEQYQITNPEMTPEELGKKFCRLDISMNSRYPRTKRVSAQNKIQLIVFYNRLDFVLVHEYIWFYVIPG